jgi:hypothetical protein
VKPTRALKKRKQVNPLFAVIVILVVLGGCMIIGWKLTLEEKRPVQLPPQMSPSDEKQRMKESMTWKEELKRAEREHRPLDYSKLPRTGHAGGGGPMVPPTTPSATK